MSGRSLSALIGLLALTSCGGGGSNSVSSDAPIAWGQLRATSDNQGFVEREGTARGTVDWTARVEGAVTAGITIDASGNLRVKPTGDRLYCLSPSGDLRWRRSIGPGAAAGVIDLEGNTFIGTDDGKVHRLTPRGAVRSVELGDDLGTGLAFAADRLVFPGRDGALHFLRTDLEVEVTLTIGPLGENVVPVLVNSRQMMAASRDGNLYEIALAASGGAPRRGVTIPLPGAVSRSSPAADGRAVYVVTDDDVLVKVFHDVLQPGVPGRIVWAFDPRSRGGSGGAGGPALAPGRVYFGTQDGRLIALDRNGRLLWQARLNAAVTTAPIVDRDLNVYVRLADGSVTSVDRDGRLGFQRTTGSSGGTAPLAMDFAGRVYLGEPDGQIRRLGDSPTVSQVGYDATHRAVAPVEGPDGPQLDWTWKSKSPVVLPPLTLGDGSVLLYPEKGILHQVSANGLRARSPFGDNPVASFIATSDDLVVITTTDGRLAVWPGSDTSPRKLSYVPQPRQEWQLVSGDQLSPLTFDGQHLVYAASTTGELFRVDLRTDQLTRIPIAPTHAAPSLTSTGDLVVATIQGRLLHLTPDGTILEDDALPGPVTRNSPLVGANDRVYTWTDEEVLACTSLRGEPGWVFDPGTSGGGRGLAQTPDGTIVAVTADGTVLGRHPDGSERFTTSLGSGTDQPISCDQSGRTFVTTVDGVLHVLSPDGVPLYRLGASALGDRISAAPTLVGERALCLTTADGGIHYLRDRPPWPMARGSADGRGRQLISGPGTAAVDWSLSVGGTLRTAPVLTPSGTILVTSEEGDLKRVSPDGVLLGQAPVGPAPRAAAVRENGLTVAGAEDGTLTAWDSTGKRLWSRSLPGPISDVTIRPDHTLLVGSGALLYCLDDAGETLWSTRVGLLSRGAPAVAVNGYLVVVTVRGDLLGLNPYGRFSNWCRLPGRFPTSSPAVTPSGGAYVTNRQDRLFAIGPYGGLEWSFDPGTGLLSGGVAAPALAVDGTVVFGTADGFLYGVHPDGSQRFQYDAGAAITGAPLIDGEGRVYAGDDAGTLHAIDLDGNVVFTFPIGASLTAAALDRDGSLILGDSAGMLYRISP